MSFITGINIVMFLTLGLVFNIIFESLFIIILDRMGNKIENKYLKIFIKAIMTTYNKINIFMYYVILLFASLVPVALIYYKPVLLIETIIYIQSIFLNVGFSSLLLYILNSAKINEKTESNDNFKLLVHLNIQNKRYIKILSYILTVLISIAGTLIYFIYFNNFVLGTQFINFMLNLIWINYVLRFYLDIKIREIGTILDNKANTESDYRLYYYTYNGLRHIRKYSIIIYVACILLILNNFVLSFI